MRKLSALFFVILLASALPTYAGLITFSEVPLGTSVNTQYVGVGVVFTPTGSGTAFTGNSPAIASPGTGEYLEVHTVPPLSTPWATLVVDFVAPGSSTPGWIDGTSLSFVLWDTESSVNFATYDVSGVLIGTGSLSTNVPTSFSGFSGAVHSIVFTDTGGDGHVLDQLNFGAITAIPEPGTFALLGAGLWALGLIRHRRKQS